MDTTVANTILQQLGGFRFAAMTGAKNFIGDKDSLLFKIGRNTAKVALVKIRLNGKDLYDMMFYKSSGDLIDEVKDLYAEDLERVFTDKTKLYTRL